MTRLPTVTPREVDAALLKAGFEAYHQSGSHLLLRHPLTKARTTVPMHARDLDRGLLRKILKQAGLTDEQFRELL